MRYSPNGGTTFGTYYYVLNLQGDVVRLITSGGTVIANYEYNAWGELLSVTNSTGTEITTATHVGLLNPLRYRGYYYDTETGFYYLQSRYYDPVTHRFINADSYASTGQGLLGHNMFAYCRNNPVTRKDVTGFCDKTDDDCDGDIYEVEQYGGGGGSSGYIYGGDGWYTTSSYGTSGYTSNGYYSSSVSYTHTTNGSTTSTSTSTCSGACTYTMGTGSYFNVNAANSAIGGTNPLAGIKYTDKVITQMSIKDNHGFPAIVDNHGALGNKEVIRGGDGKSYFKLQIRGSYHGNSGFFEYIWNSETGECNHRFFRKLK